MSSCIHCGKSLTSDEIAIHRKLVSREATEYMCKTCLAQYFGISEEKIEEKIEQFKRMGCMLFQQK